MIQSELRMFAASFGFGAGIIISYGVTELFRQFCGFGKAAKVVSELLYWIIAAILAFLLQFRLNNGVLRLYSVVGAAAGMLLFQWMTGKMFFSFCGKVRKTVRKRKLRNKNRRLAVQNQLKKLWKQVKIKFSSLRKQREVEEGES